MTCLGFDSIYLIFLLVVFNNLTLKERKMESSQYKYQVSNIHLFLNMNSMLLTRLPVKVEESPLISKFTSRIATPHHPNTAYLIDKRRVIEEWTSAKVYECIDENYFNKQGLSPAQNLKARN